MDAASLLIYSEAGTAVRLQSGADQTIHEHRRLRADLDQFPQEQQFFSMEYAQHGTTQPAVTAEHSDTDHREGDPDQQEESRERSSLSLRHFPRSVVRQELKVAVSQPPGFRVLTWQRNPDDHWVYRTDPVLTEVAHNMLLILQLCT